MGNPRIEEVDDDVSDPDEMDVDAFDFANPQHRTLAATTSPDAAPKSQIDPQTLQSLLQSQNTQQPSGGAPQQSDKERARLEREQRERSKSYQCIYPVYFDASRSRHDGRRVKKSEAVQNPLAREIVDALRSIGNERGLGATMQVVFEPAKTHPKDWANPGRVRVLVKEDGMAVSAKLANSESLLLHHHFIFLRRRGEV